jgi:hypothetical protein
VFRRRCTRKAIVCLYKGVSPEMYARGMGTEEAPSASGCTCSAVAKVENEVGE